MVGRVPNRHAAVYGDVGIAAKHQLVRELSNGNDRVGVFEGGHLRGQVTVNVRPRRRGTGVDAEAVVPVDAILDVEGSPQAGDDPIVVAQPSDLRRRAVSAGPRFGTDIEYAFVRSRWSGAGSADR